MFLLTKNQLEQIRKYIATYGIRTTDFPDTPTVTADDYVAIVQGGVNKKVKLSDLFDESMLPSLIIDINVKDDWDEISPDDHDSALSARLGLELKEQYQPTVVVNDWTSPYITSGICALSAARGYELYNRINAALVPVDNLLEQVSLGRPLDAHQGYVLSQMLNLKANNSDVYNKTQVYTKAEVDALIGGGGGGGDTTALADLTDDVDVVTVAPVNGNVLTFNGTKWVPGTASAANTWRNIYVNGNEFLGVSDTNPLKLVAGSNVTLTPGTNGEITISSTGGGGGGTSGPVYIGTTLGASSSNSGQALTGIGLVEIVGTNSQKRIYFGTAGVSSTPYIEWDATNECFHFSHGLYSDDFVTAGGYNGASGGGGGSSTLAGLTDVSLGTLGVLDNGKVLTYVNDGVNPGVWQAVTPSGGSGGSSVAWGTPGSDYVPLTVDNVTKTLITAHQDLSGYQPLIDSTHKLNWSYITGGPTELPNPYSLQFGIKSYNGASNVILYAEDIMNDLEFGNKGSNRKRYNGSSYVQFTIDELTNHVIGTADGSYIQIGNIKIQYVSSDNALKVITSSGGNANFYATGNLAAGA